MSSKSTHKGLLLAMRVCQKSQLYAPKGQKLIAQGRSALPLA